MISRKPWKDTIQDLQKACQAAGLHLVQSFNLQDARMSLVEATSCKCPHHGTARCSCQYLIYLVYDESRGPITLVVHGSDDYTELSFEELGSVRDRQLQTNLIRAIKNARISA